MRSEEKSDGHGAYEASWLSSGGLKGEKEEEEQEHSLKLKVRF